MELICVPGHRSIEGNGMDNEYSENGLFLNEFMSCNDFLTPLVIASNRYLKNIMDALALQNSKKTLTLLHFDEVFIMLLVGFISGYCRIRCMEAVWSKKRLNQHLLCYKSVLQGRRLQFLCMNRFRDFLSIVATNEVLLEKRPYLQNG